MKIFHFFTTFVFIFTFCAVSVLQNLAGLAMADPFPLETDVCEFAAFTNDAGPGEVSQIALIQSEVERIPPKAA